MIYITNVHSLIILLNSFKVNLSSVEDKCPWPSQPLMLLWYDPEADQRQIEGHPLSHLCNFYAEIALKRGYCQWVPVLPNAKYGNIVLYFKITVLYQKLSYIWKKRRRAHKLHNGKTKPCTPYQCNSTEALSFERDRNCMLHTTQSITSHHTITPLFLLISTKAPYLHRVSVFYHRELNSLREMAKLSYICPFLAYIIQRATLP